MSLSLGGASSPLSYKENILRAPPGFCHQLGAAIACQGLFSPEPDALSELCRNLSLNKTSQLLCLTVCLWCNSLSGDTITWKLEQMPWDSNTRLPPYPAAIPLSTSLSVPDLAPLTLAFTCLFSRNSMVPHSLTGSRQKWMGGQRWP